MRPKHPQPASLEQVRITRDADAALIEFADPALGRARFTIGPEVQHLTDEEILERYNACVQARLASAEAYEHCAVEIPPGRPQLEYVARADRWVPRGDVLRCAVCHGPDQSPVIHIDDHEMTIEEFGRLLATRAGWGMRVVFTPENETHRQHPVEVRDPEEDAS
jgi:hypothetical protein